MKWSEQQRLKRRVKRDAWTHKLSPTDRDMEKKAYSELANSFDDPMWVKKEQDWYMVSSMLGGAWMRGIRRFSLNCCACTLILIFQLHVCYA